ncbi:Rossmann-like and DUF2520 domain-containing protein [Massilia sp. CFBP9012]|uniref:Rossmann-like and DUF2520 domain-containing protein n=1 Tax=Massilia sp. CFBP9012 TaxID=3096531 RepID=UPI002A6A1F99|nr:Rossmann-like and DUF2520 domain-containing protein [Massilia sp. CFBP9012]MDY0974339.1 Rossmann-like and DUF2520 domain-containing protein [Massilia sp. CFBP9012]
MVASLNLVGAGHVGKVLGRLLSASGCCVVQDVLTRSPASARAAVDFIDAGRACADLAQLRPADIWLLAVNDDQIAPMAAALAQAHEVKGAVVFHCSGAKASSQLQALSDQGALVASVHPIRSFADPDAVAREFAGTFCGIEGEAEALARLAPAFETIGARLVTIDAAAKTVYHAAAVFASNYLTTVLDAALRAYQAAGVPEPIARELARPLASETMANVFRLGSAAALSGPVARGDHATVARQQQALLDWDEATGKLYEALVPLTADLARRKHAAS